MKDLTQIGKNINRSGMTEHKEIVIDDFAKNIINKVFDQLSIIFPAWQYNWKTQKEIDGAKMEWTKAFNENNIRTTEQISYGFAKARKSETDFLPSCGKFISWCTPSPEDLGFPNEQQALKQCINHRNAVKMHMDSNASHFIQTLCKCIDWWQMNTANGQQQIKQANAAFKDEYLDLIKNYQEPVESSHNRLETSEIVTKRMSQKQKDDARQRGLDVLKAARKKLKNK